MDAFVQLALMEKAKQVFAGDPSLMLCFPLLSPVSFTAEELATLTDPQSTDYAAASDFARIVNFLPQDMVASASDRMLWQVYRDVLDRADVARDSAGVDTPDPDAALLWDVAADGSRTESAAYGRYRQYRDAWIVTRENYAQHKLTGELSDDPAVRQAWTEVDEPRLRAEVDAAARAWEEQGQRTAIERALKADRDASLRSPALRWARWRDAFNPDLDIARPAGVAEFAPTGLSPLNFADQEDWLRFELSAGEMQALVDAAPAALRNVLDEGAQTDVERVSFEYRSVAIVRPWFQPDLFTSRIWRSSDPDLVLSDGADPPHGACPYYVSACVFVRNVVEVQKPRAGQPGGSRTYTHFDLGKIRPQLLAQRELRVDPSILATVAARRAIAPVPAPAPALEMGKLRAFRLLQRNSFNLADAMAPPPDAAAATGASRFATSAMRRRLFGGGLAHVELSPHIALGELVATAPTATPLPTPTPAPRDELSVLAFICKRLPKAPDPAPELSFL